MACEEAETGNGSTGGVGCKRSATAGIWLEGTPIGGGATGAEAGLSGRVDLAVEGCLEVAGLCIGIMGSREPGTPAKGAGGRGSPDIGG